MKTNFAYLILLLSISLTAAAQDVSVYARVDDKEPIYAGQRFSFYVIIDGDNTPATVDDTPLKPFSPHGPQVRDVSQSSTVIINGKTTTKQVKRYLISYSLAAPTAGEYVIPSLRVEVGSDIHNTDPVQFEVIEPETTNRIAIEARLSEQECYKGQPVALEVKWYIWKDIAQRVSDYMFNVPVFGMEDFLVEDLSVQSAAANQTTLQVNGVDVVINQRAVKYKGAECVEVSFSKVLIPQKTGEINLGTVSVLCRINLSRSRFTLQSEYKSYGARTESLKLKVLDLPEQGKPDDFYGLIGSYDIKTEAQPTDVKVGDPITLNISIGGSGYLKPVQWPQLSSVREIKDNFILPSEQSSPEIVDRRKVFTQTIRARNADIRRIPPISLSFFDTDAGEYATVESEPIELKVSPTKVLTLSDVQSGSETSSGRRLEAVKGGISANYAGSELLEDMSFVPHKELMRFPIVLIWAGPFALFASTLIFQLTTRDKDARKERRRKRLAAKRCVTVLKSINAADQNAKTQLAAAVKTYFADRFDKSAGSLTCQDCRDIVEQHCGDQSAAAAISEILEKCEAAQYSPLSVKFDDLWKKEAIKTIERIEKCLR
jgi:hypothetical protein